MMQGSGLRDEGGRDRKTARLQDHEICIIGDVL